MNHDAFVSYASSDRVVAYRMVDYLESCGVRCWVAPRDVPGGRNYAEAILSALTEADLFLLLFSDESNGSEHVQREVERALHLTKPIVPVRIRDVFPSGAMDYYLATLHWIDAFSPESGDATDENAAGVELGCEDVARAAGSLLNRDEDVAEAIAGKRRLKEEAAELRRIEAEEREVRLRLEAEARAKAEMEAAALAKAEIEAEDRRRREAEERQRKAELDQRERERERQRKRELESKKEQQRERELELQREQAAETERQMASAALATVEPGRDPLPKSATAVSTAASAPASSRTLFSVLAVLLAVVVGVGWWAKQHFAPDGGGDKPPGSLVGGPAEAPGTEINRDPISNPVPAENPAVAVVTPPVPLAPTGAHPIETPKPLPPMLCKVRASFQWAGEHHAVAAVELFQMLPENRDQLGEISQRSEWLDILVPRSETSDAKDEDPEVEVGFDLAIPGFSTIGRRVVLQEGEMEIDFGTLERSQGEVSLQSGYIDSPRAADAHAQWLGKVQLVWEGIAESDLAGIKYPPTVVERVASLQSTGSTVKGEWAAQDLAVAEVSTRLDTGVYGAFLETSCQAPFDRIRIAQLVVSKNQEVAPLVRLPIVPIGVFGGQTPWTSTSTDSAQDEDGTVAWNLYNLPVALDLSEDGPRMVQSYVDIVGEGTHKKTIYLPAPVTEVRYDPENQIWTLRADPTEIVRLLVDDDLNDRYFEPIDFALRHHADKRSLLFDAEAVDQPLNATTGKVRSFPMNNAYPVLASGGVKALDAAQPGFGIVDVAAVYAHVESISNKQNAEDYRRTLTMPIATTQPLGVHLGIKPDTDYTGSDSCRVDAVEAGSPADAAGLKVGDLVVSMAGVEIGGIGDFYRVRFALQVGVSSEFKVLRGGREIALAITPEAVE